MTTKKTRARADRLAADYAIELKQLEQQQRAMRAEIRAKKRALRAAEQANLKRAHQELGTWIADLAGATTADSVDALRQALTDLDVAAQLRTHEAAAEHRGGPQTETDPAQIPATAPAPADTQGNNF